jgi:hypothetical protein
MLKQLLTMESKFELMVAYQVSIESNSIIIENAENDPYRYTLYEIAEQVSYEEYINGNEFELGRILKHSNSTDDLHFIQEGRRKVTV